MSIEDSSAATATAATTAVGTHEPHIVQEARRIVANRQMANMRLTALVGGEIVQRRQRVDVTTALMICRVWDKLAEPSRTTLRDIIEKKGSLLAIQVMWKSVSK
mgnify:CR=1 FL=1